MKKEFKQNFDSHLFEHENDDLLYENYGIVYTYVFTLLLR